MTLPMTFVPCAGPRRQTLDNHVEGTGRRRGTAHLQPDGFRDQAGYNIDASEWVPLGGTRGNDRGGVLVVFGEMLR